MSEHERQEDPRDGEHAITDIGQLILLVVLLATWITDSFFFRYSMFLANIIPVYVRLPVAAIVFGIGALFLFSAHKTIFGSPDREPGVVVAGVYRLARHPMYFGAWLFFFGVGITTLSVTTLAVAVLTFIFYICVARHEEKNLEARFGDEYLQYKERVPLFVPTPWRFRQNSRKRSS